MSNPMDDQYDDAAAAAPAAVAVPAATATRPTYSLRHGWQNIDGTPQEGELPFEPVLARIPNLPPFPSGTAMEAKDRVIPDVVSRASGHNDFTNRLKDNTINLLSRNKEKITKLKKQISEYKKNNPMGSSSYSNDKEKEYLFKLKLLNQERDKLYKDFIDKSKSTLNANRKMNYNRKIAELKRALDHNKKILKGLIKKAKKRKNKGGTKRKRKRKGKTKRKVRKRRTKKRKSINKRRTKRKQYS